MKLIHMLLASVVMASASGPAWADLLELDLLIQANAAGTKLITGWYDDGDNTRGQPQWVFGGELNPTVFDGDEPGIRSVDVSIPAGMSALPGSQGLFIDLLPMTIGMTSSDLFFWNGTGNVTFSSVAPGYELTVSGTGGFSVTANGTNTPKTDTDPFVTTGSTGTIHKHPTYALSNSGTPDEGLYLISLGMRMPSTSLADADPVYLVFATSSISGATHHLAAHWVNDNLVAVPEPSTYALMGGVAVAAIPLARRFRRRR